MLFIYIIFKKQSYVLYMVYIYHRRRMETEAKAKVDAPVWGGKMYTIPCIDLCKTASAARNWINFVSQTCATTFAFAPVSFLLLWYLLKFDCTHHGERAGWREHRYIAIQDLTLLIVINLPSSGYLIMARVFCGTDCLSQGRRGSRGPSSGGRGRSSPTTTLYNN